MTHFEQLITWVTTGGLAAVMGTIALIVNQIGQVSKLRKEVEELKQELAIARETIDKLKGLLEANNIQYKAIGNYFKTVGQTYSEGE